MILVRRWPGYGPTRPAELLRQIGPPPGATQQICAHAPPLSPQSPPHPDRGLDPQVPNAAYPHAIYPPGRPLSPPPRACVSPGSRAKPSACPEQPLPSYPMSLPFSLASDMSKYFYCLLSGLLHFGFIDVLVGDKANHILSLWHRQDPALLQFLNHQGGCNPQPFQIHHNDVRLHWMRDRHAIHFTQVSSKQSCVLVVVRQPVYVVLQRIETRGRQHPYLPHRPTVLLANVTQLVNNVTATCDSRSGGGAQTLGEAGHHRVGRLGILGRIHAGSHGGIPNPRSIQMNNQTGLVSYCRSLLQGFQGPYGPTGYVVGVLQTQQAGTRRVFVGGANRMTNHF